MKKKLALIICLMLVIVSGVQAQNTGNTHYALSELAVSPFTKIVVNAHIDVVLVQNDTLKKAFIEGDEVLVPEIAVTVSNGVLTIASRRQISYRGKVQVTIAVNELSKLEINADAGIVSQAPLHSPKIAVNINGYCDIRLKSTGEILLEAEDGYGIRYKGKS
jgi:hypothetical protein